MYPFFSFVALALGTMAIAARIVTNTHVATSITGIHMTAHDGSSTMLYRSQGAQLPTI
jgi:hypothetical protein